MKITVAIDSFKGSLTSAEAGEAVRAAARKVYPDAEIAQVSLADGGEGTLDALISAVGGERRAVSVKGPLGETVRAEYGVLKDGTAVVEIAAASGLTLVSEKKRDPLAATTYGVGELIAHAIERGSRKFIIGLGGSATNDAGAGMLLALGYKLLDINGRQISLGAKGLSELAAIDTSKHIPELSECEFVVACDVKNPLTGSLGASAVFGPQKGASAEDIVKLDAWLSDFARLTAETLGESREDSEGAGAAGGLGFAFISYLGARLTSGIDLIISASGIEKCIKDSDIVITGEGRLDGQSGMGKAPVGVARLAKKYGKLVIAFSGSVADGASVCNEQGIDAYFPIIGSPCTLDEAMDKQKATENLKRTAEQALRLVRAVGSSVKAR